MEEKLCLNVKTQMAPDSEDDDGNDAVSSQPLTEETTATKRQRFTTFTEPLTPPPPPLPTLPFELVVEILCRLPVKSLSQLRCVCKPWNSLISDPKFAKKHLRCSPADFTRHHLILTYTNAAREFILTAYPLRSILNAVTAPSTQLEYPLNNRNRFDLIVGSCDGIICFAIDQSFALLWNPTTRRFKKLPSLENPRREGSYTIYGFGYDHFSDCYKVVAVFCYECDSGSGGYKTQVKVYTLGSDSWRQIQDFPSGVPFDETGRFVSGSLNWLASVDSSWVIVSLDLGKECYQELSLPDCGDAALTLGVLRDCLCIVTHHYEFSDVWLMKEYGNKESWTKIFSVPSMGEQSPYTKTLHISEDDEVLLEFQSQLVVYNFRDCTFKTPQIQNITSWMVPDVYVESLISPCS